MTINDWLEYASDELAQAGISSSRLDAALILSHTLRRGRTWLHAHSDETLGARDRDIADARLALRSDRVPVAYIIGHKQFYRRQFSVTTETLIPRPESETLIELLAGVLRDGSFTSPRLVDVGTGSGALGITAKLEHPELSVALLDIDTHALNVAGKNAEALGADVELIPSNLLAAYPYIADIVMANLPYVDTTWERSPETDHEPAVALFADDGGMALIKQLLETIPQHTSPDAYVILEADPIQHHALTVFAESHGLRALSSTGYGLLLQRSPAAAA